MAFEFIQQVESFPQCRAGHRKKPCEAVAQKKVDQRACVLETGPRVLETGPRVLETGPRVLETGPRVLETGPCVLETGPRVLETGLCVLETGLCVLETGPCVLETGACILETDAFFVAMECQIQYLMSQPSRRNAPFGSLFFSICVHP